MPGQKRRLLVVDDEAGLQRLVRRQAEAAGFEVTTADTGAAGVQLALSEQPDVILLDLGLPDTSGIEVVASLKRDPQTASIPILVWSGSDESEGSARAFEAGAAAYLDKIEIAALVGKLHELLDG
jgi:CheY-like chemotaxis protein